MPRCFLAKKSPLIETSNLPAVESIKTEPLVDDERQLRPILEPPQEVPLALTTNNRSALGSISAAEAVRSIQEPLPPACNNKPHNVVLPNQPLPLLKLPPAAAAGDKSPKSVDAAKPGIVIKQEVLEEQREGDSNDDDPALVVLEHRPKSSQLQHQQGQQQPHERPRLVRVHTKEEEDAAHDLLELSRSLPPLAGPVCSLRPSHPPTPPSPPEDQQQQQQYTTLIYVTRQQQQSPSGSSLNEYPLTPPTDSASDSSVDLSSPTPPSDRGRGSPALSIADGRTKKSKYGIAESNNAAKAKYVCTECGKNYATSSNLSRHKQTHRSLDSNNAKKCHICGKMYVSMPALSMHILTHNLNHKCEVCGKAFSRPWLLQGHLRSHTGQKPYSCTVCNKSFADRSNLRAHMQTHSPSKNFQCSRCNKTFALKSYLNKHYESACVRSSSSSSSSSRHNNSHHSVTT